MLELKDISFGTTVRDAITGVSGIVTGKFEPRTGTPSVKIESMDSTGRPFLEWVELDRAELAT